MNHKQIETLFKGELGRLDAEDKVVLAANKDFEEASKRIDNLTGIIEIEKEKKNDKQK